MTARAVVREMAIVRDREADRDLTLAWTTVRLYAEWRTKKLPALAGLLSTASTATAAPPPARPYGQTIAEQRAMLDILARRHGGRVREVRT
jgi:hypothetical protein